MERYFILDKFNTWFDWDLILTEKNITPPEVKTNLVELDGMNGSLDLTESLSGEPTYKDRTIEALFWTDKGSRRDRTKLIRDIRTAVHGRKIKIVEPDDPDHYFIGRVNIKDEVNILPYAELTLEATCDPWRYATHESERVIELTSDPQDVVIYNGGRKTLSPTLSVNGSVKIEFGSASINLESGGYMLSGLKLYHGFNTVRVSGSGDLTIRYREADL